MSIFNTNALISKILIVIMLSSVSLSVSSKVGKYKYSKYVRYEGELDSNHRPNGKGTLFITNREKDATLKVDGIYVGVTAKNVSFSNLGFLDYTADKTKYFYAANSMEISVSEKGDNVTLKFHSIAIYRGYGDELYISHIDVLDYAGEFSNKGDLKSCVTSQGYGILHRGWVNLPPFVESYNVKSEEVSVKISNYLSIEEIKPQKIILKDGKIFKFADNSTSYHTYSYPNGSLIKYTKHFHEYSFTLKLDGGVLEKKGTSTKITYNNGNVFSSDLPKSFEYTESGGILNSKRISDFRILNGTLTRHQIVETYRNGHVISVRYPLFDSGSVNAYVNAFPTHRVSIYDINCTELSYREYDGSVVEGNPKDLKHILNDDVVEYFHKSDIKTELQKKAFAQTPEYEQLYNKLQITKNHLYEDEYVVEMSAHDLKYDVNLGCFQLDELRYATDNHLVEGNPDYHLIFRDYYKLCLTYPRSLVDKKTIKNFWGGDDHHWVTAWTGKVSESDALKFENNKESCKLCWFFKFEGVNDYRYIYGKTTRIYLVNKETGEIYCDLSNSLKASNSKFKSLNVSRDSLPKKTYHSKGEVENCGLCFGTGKGWSAGTHCPQCGGKGWYIEHYW